MTDQPDTRSPAELRAARRSGEDVSDETYRAAEDRETAGVDARIADRRARLNPTRTTTKETR